MTIKYDHLLQLPFEHGVRDCYTIAQKMFEANTPDIRLSNYARPTDWWLGDEDLYVKNFKTEGFSVLEDTSSLRPLDAFLICIPDLRERRDRYITNHCAIYLGDGFVIHHRLGMLSEKAPYRGWLRSMTTHVLRHDRAPKIETPTIEIDLMDKILPHKRDRILKALRAKSEKTS